MSMAVQYAMQKRGKKMASGGACEHGSTSCKMCHGGMYAEGGEVSEKPVDMSDIDDLVSRIMKRRTEGQEANDTPPIADFEENQFDDLVKRGDDMEFSYTGENSGDEIGNEQEDKDRADIIARIMKSRRLKDRNPSPA